MLQPFLIQVLRTTTVMPASSLESTANISAVLENNFKQQHIRQRNNPKLNQHSENEDNSVTDSWIEQTLGNEVSNGIFPSNSYYYELCYLV